MSPRVWKVVAVAAVFASLLVLSSITSPGDLDPGVGAVCLALLACLAAAVYILVLYYLVLCFHELGHYIAGKAVGFDFYAVQIGPRCLARYTRGYRLFKAKTTPATGGLVIMVPRQFSEDLSRFRWNALGGPIASLLLAFAGLYLWRSLKVAEDSSLRLHVISATAGLTGLLASLMFIRSLIPENGTDGSLLLQSFREPESLRRTVAAGMIVGPWRYGVRAANWSGEAIEYLLSHPWPENKYAPWVSLVAYYHALDVSKHDEAAKWIRRTLELQGLENGNDGLYGEAAYARAFLERNLEEARELLDRIEIKSDDTYHAYQRAEVAILALEGRMIEARDRAYEVYELLLQAPRERIEDTIQFEIDRLQEIIGEPLFVGQTAG